MKKFEENHQLNSRRYPGFPEVVDRLRRMNGRWRYTAAAGAVLSVGLDLSSRVD